MKQRRMGLANGVAHKVQEKRQESFCCMKCGLVSISFRDNTPEEIIEAAANAGLDCIEWGSDVHLKADDIPRARQIKSQTLAAGLAMPSYGTYFGIEKPDWDGLEQCLKMADQMEIPMLRIWPPDQKKPDYHSARYKEYVVSCRRVADRAKQYHKLICFECHQGILTDNYQTTLKFIEDIDRENIKMYWQPNQFKSFAYNLEAARELRHLVTNIHVFHWKNMDRFPLAQGESEWKAFAQLFRQSGRENVYMLEFMYNDSIAALKSETEAMKKILNGVYA